MQSPLQNSSMESFQSHKSADLWGQALQELHPDDKQQVSTFQYDHKRVLHDVLKEAQAKRDETMRKRWRFKKSDGSTIILRDVFEKVVHWVSKFAQVMDVAVNVDPVHAGLPWAAVHFLLKISVSDVQAFGCMSEGIEVVSSVLVRYRILEYTYNLSTPASDSDETLHLGRCIIQVYAAVLRYLATARRFWSQNTARRMTKALFKDMEAEHLVLQSAVSKADDEAFKTANVVQYQHLLGVSETTQKALTGLLKDVQNPIYRIAQSISEIQDRLRQDERKEIFHWLSTIPCESHHQEVNKRILGGTGSWLLECPEYLKWQNSSSSDIFWCHGIPGAGKSALTSIVVQTMLEQQKIAPTKSPPLAYFYCSGKGTDSRNASPEEILRALLRQLIGRDIRLPTRGSVAQDYQRKKEQADMTGAQTPSLGMEEIVAHILKITADDPVILVVDALDEIDHVKRGDLFDALDQIVQESQNVVKIFLSSRNDGDIVDRFDHYSHVLIDESLNRDDITHFVQHKVDQAIKSKKLLRGRVTSFLRDEIITTLGSSAQGMFRWVELSVDMLSNSKRMSVEKDVRTELGKLPAELAQQYAIIYTDILESAPSTTLIAKRTFSWMLAAQRVMTIEELIAAVALDDDGYYHKDLDVSGLLDICRNLIVVTMIDNNPIRQSFEWAHLSVREFFDKLSDYSPDHIHTVAVLRCLRSFDLTSQSGKKLSSAGLLNPDALRAYSIYLFEHAEISELRYANSRVAPHMKAFLFDQQYKPSAMFIEWQRLIEDFKEDSIWPQDSKDMPLFHKREFDDVISNGVQVICIYGLLSVINMLDDIESIPWKVYKSEYESNALYAATENGNVDVVKWLLERKIFGANETHGSLTALYMAVGKQQEDIVALLLEHGADPLWDSQEGFHGTPLHIAFRGRSLTIFERLLRQTELLYKDSLEKSSVLAFDWKSEALFEALREDWSPASQLLIHCGANIYLPVTRTGGSPPHKHYHSTILQAAVECSESVVVKLLLEKSSQSIGAKVLEVTGLSKAHLAYINALDQNKRSALHYLMGRKSSAVDESNAIMKMLLKFGADSTSVSDEGITVLHVAAAIGSLDSVNLLMEMGLDMKALTSDGATILHIAAGGICSTAMMIRYLIDKGVNPLSRDRDGRTSLHYAAAACNVPALLALLEHISRVDKLSQYQVKEMAISHIVTQKTYPASQQSPELKTLLDDVDGKGETLLHVLGSERKNTLFRYNVRNERQEKVVRVRDTARLLLNLGASINRMAHNGRTPLIALLSLSVDPLGFLSGNAAAKELLAKGADPNIPDVKGQTPLHYAARCRFKEGARDLIQAGANIEAKDHTLFTPLHVASQSGYPQMVKLLLSENAHCDARDHIEATPLHYAAQRSFWEVGKLGSGFDILVKKGADIHASDLSGATPLHWAAKSGQLYSVQRLIRAGANPEVIDQFGATAMQQAARHASLLTENEVWGANYINVWVLLFRASERWCRSNNIRPRTFLKRSQSFIHRTDHSWGDFDETRAKEFARV